MVAMIYQVMKLVDKLVTPKRKLYEETELGSRWMQLNTDLEPRPHFHSAASCADEVGVAKEDTGTK